MLAWVIALVAIALVLRGSLTLAAPRVGRHRAVAGDDVAALGDFEAARRRRRRTAGSCGRCAWIVHWCVLRAAEARGAAARRRAQGHGWPRYCSRRSTRCPRSRSSRRWRGKRANGSGRSTARTRRGLPAPRRCQPSRSSRSSSACATARCGRCAVTVKPTHQRRNADRGAAGRLVLRGQRAVAGRCVAAAVSAARQSARHHAGAGAGGVGGLGARVSRRLPSARCIAGSARRCSSCSTGSCCAPRITGATFLGGCRRCWRRSRCRRR